jgi:ketosteroid isomerase-like protein
MKNKIATVLILGFMTSLAVACNDKKEETAAPAAVDKEQIKKDIQAKEDEYAATYNAGELKNIGYYADDATSFYPNKAPLVGKEAIVSFLTSDLVSNTDSLSFKTNEVFVSNDGNQVVEIGYYKLVDSVKAILKTGNYMSMFEKRNGKYVSLRDMSTSDIPIK